MTTFEFLKELGYATKNKVSNNHSLPEILDGNSQQLEADYWKNYSTLIQLGYGKEIEMKVDLN